MAFRVGQKVVCVDADGAAMLIKDMVYTIKSIDPLAVRKWRLQIMEIASLQLYEVSPEFNFVGFAPQRFRPAVDRGGESKGGLFFAPASWAIQP